MNPPQPNPSGKPGEIVVFMVRRETLCADCGHEISDGDLLRLDAVAGTLEAQVPAAEWAQRPAATADLSANAFGMGRELFNGFRATVAPADEGAGVFS